MLSMLYSPFPCTTRYSAAFNAPSANTPLDWALCVISKLSVSEKNITVCFPTTFPPLIEWMPISFGFLFSLFSCLLNS